jgi:hypothetical protein
MKIRVFTSELQAIAQIELFESFVFERKLYGSGKFQITSDLNSNENIKELQINRIIVVDDDFTKVGLIKEINYKLFGNRKQVIVSGYELKGAFKTRVTIPTIGNSHHTFTNTAVETVIKELINQNCIENYPLPIDIDTDLARGQNISLSTRYRNLEEELIKICSLTSSGYNVEFDIANERLLLTYVEGLDKTAGQSTNNRVILSSDFDIIQNFNFTQSEIDFFNKAIIGGQGEGVDREIFETTAADTGFNLSVLFVDARDIAGEDQLLARGLEKISNTPKIENFSLDIYPYGTFTYQTDYDLGDFVTIRQKITEDLTVTADAQIMSITEVYDRKQLKLIIEFNQAKKTISEKLKFETEKTVI